MSKPLLADPKRTRLKRSPLKRRTCLKRLTPLRKAKPSVKGAQAKQRRAVKERSGGRCEFRQQWFLGCDARCPAEGQEMAHIFPRRECGKARDLPEVVLWACRYCHDVYDKRQRAVFKRIVPEGMLSAAREAIAVHTKVPVRP
jgi:hypothetical protein